MSEYPGLLDKVSLAGPDVVAHYKNPHSEFDAYGWVTNTAAMADSIVGIYDIHAYPGQYEVRSGRYGETLAAFRSKVPAGKKIVLGEAGFKYQQTEDSLLLAEYKRRVENHPFTKGSDCNMLCYDYFYGLDMPMLAMEVMNHGFSGLAIWMLDDAMHSNGDTGRPEDIKIWGLWNILGNEVFNKPDEEAMRPLYYTWSLMCKYFPKGTNILKTSRVANEGVFCVAGEYQGHNTIAIVNVGDADKTIQLLLPTVINNADKYLYEETHQLKGTNGFPIPVEQNLTLNSG
jgi:hypothetical protein